jgi:uncharacterized protein YoxC
MSTYRLQLIFLVTSLVTGLRGSIVSDHSSAFESKAKSILRAILWALFREHAFCNDPEEGTDESAFGGNKEFRLNGANYEIDFCSHLRVDKDLQIREDAKCLKEMVIVDGTFELWRERILRKQEEIQPTRTDFTPPCKVENPTHYVIGEAKTPTTKASLPDRATQLERNASGFCQLKGAETKEEILSKALEIIALIGIAVPKRSQLTAQNVHDYINSNAKKFPILWMLLNEKRVFLVLVDSMYQRVEGIEKHLEQLAKGATRLQQDVGTRMEELQQDVGTRMEELQQDVGTRMEELQQDVGALQQEMGARMTAIETRMEELQQDVGTRMGGMQKLIEELLNILRRGNNETTAAREGDGGT